MTTGEPLPFDAVLWDFDGTLVDTEPYWIAAEYRLAESYGASWSDEHGLAVVGNALVETGRYMIAVTGMPLTPEQVVDRLLDDVVAQLRVAIPWRPHVRDLLAELGDRGIPCGMVTMSYQRFVAPVLEALPSGTFGSVITGDMVTHGKPHPEPYLAGAAGLGLAPQRCLAIEDSRTGAVSAVAAGCPTIVVPVHVAVEESAGSVVREELPDTVDGLVSMVSDLLATR